MTSLRTPGTFAWAMTRVAGVIGWPECVRIAQRTERQIRHWSQEDHDSYPTIDLALDFDAAYRKAGGEGAPFLEAFAFQLEVTIARQQADRRQLCAEVALSSKEHGEAVAAALAVSNDPNASPLAVHRAVAEVTEAAEALGAVRRRLASFLPASFGEAGEAGRENG